MSAREVVAVPVEGADGSTLLDPLRAALSGAGPAVHPHPRETRPSPAAVAALRADEDCLNDPVAAVVSTSGSTGAARHVLLQASAVLASAAATHDRLGGAGTWLLSVPAHTVAGLMVVARSLVARTEPAVVDLAGGFRVDGFVAAATEMPSGGRRYTSLVPTQLRRLMAGGPTALEAVRGFDAVLVGGSALEEALREEAVDAGVRVVATYGMTETCGGCVYDGTALPGVRMAVAADGRVSLGGPVVARGYRRDDVRGGMEGLEVTAEHGRRWFRTPDTGTLEDGRLAVSGRVDDVAVSGGVNVPLAPVRRVVDRLPGVRACVVVAVPDPEWGQAVGVLVEADRRAGDRLDDGGGVGSQELLAGVRAAVAREVGRAAAPRLLLVVPELPLLGVGKPDRARARELLLGPGAARTGATGDHGGRDDDDGGTRTT